MKTKTDHQKTGTNIKKAIYAYPVLITAQFVLYLHLNQQNDVEYITTKPKGCNCRTVLIIIQKEVLN